MPPAYRVNKRDRYCIRDVSTVPGEQVVEPVCRGGRDVKRVFVRFFRNTGTGHQRRSKIESFACDLRKPEPSHDGNARSSKAGVTTLRFADYDC